MKQLKFMLAAATAISLATAAQADTQPQLVKTEFSSENFDAVTTLNDTAAVLALPGFSYEGATASDNESVVVAGGADNTANALQVNTGTEPLLRKIDATGNKAVPLDATKKVYIDTMVQFTVTPYGDTVTASDNDKLMIYLKEDLSDSTAPKTNLVVKAGYKGEGSLISKDYVLDIDGKKVLPGVWYSLEVIAYGNVASVSEGMDIYPAFEIYIDGTLARIANAGVSADLQVAENIPIFMLGSYGERLSGGTLLLSMKVNSSTLDQVGFAGEGMVDELVFSKDAEPETAVDFTFTWTTAGISSVTYTIGDADPVEVTNGVKIVDLAANTVLTLNVTPADWYKVADDAVLSYTATNAGDSAVLDSLVTEVTATDLNVTVPAGTSEETTSKALAWAKNAGKTTTAVEEAGDHFFNNYLLNVADLRGGQLPVKHQKVDLMGLTGLSDLLHHAGAHAGGGVRIRPLLGDGAEGLRAGGTHQFV